MEVAKAILSSLNVPYVVAAPLLIQDLASWSEQGIQGLQVRQGRQPRQQQHVTSCNSNSSSRASFVYWQLPNLHPKGVGLA